MTPSEVLHDYLLAYEARDLPAIERLLAPEVRLQDWNLCAHGRAAVLAETRKNFDAAQSLSIRIVARYACDHGAAAELRIVVNQSIVLEVVDAITLDAHGKIASIRAYKG